MRSYTHGTRTDVRYRRRTIVVDHGYTSCHSESLFALEKALLLADPLKFGAQSYYLTH